MPQAPNHTPIALFAGRGDLPRQLISIFKSQGRPFVVLAFMGQTEDSLVKDTPHLWVHFGQVGKALAYLRQNKIQELVMAGTMTRPALSAIKTDWEGIKWLAKLGIQARGDDDLLKQLIILLEKDGFKVVGPHTILTSILAQEGLQTKTSPTKKDWLDIQRGAQVLSTLSPLDVGQAIVVQEGLILGIEAIEGTDALLKRAGTLKREGSGGVLVKMAKTQQEQRVDLPTIGLETLKRASQAKLNGIAIEPSRTLVLDQEKVLKYANEKGLFIVGLPPSI